jgi:serine/threonine-protein kinase
MTKEGTVLDGKYEILTEVGRGGMSIVYLARDNRLNKQWAVKEIKDDGKKSTKTLLKGLEREANILKNVDHPVLPRIVDIINQEGTIYVVMDFIEGTTISDRLKKEGAQPQETVIEWGLQLASALDYLHNMNPPVIYRDMKPSNVMIKPEGGVKLIDFGTAKEYTVENNADTTALGTRGYAAPEQFGDAQGRGIYKTDARTDIYNLGATLYHIVTGMNPCEPPYEIRPIREWNPALSSGLEKILLKCTQADPKDRYQNCTELMYDLEHYSELDDSHRRKNKIKVASFAATTVLTVAAGITAIVGYNGLQQIKLDNYNSYIEQGNDYKVEGDYVNAAEQYKKAFELDGSDSEAYEKYIQVYVDASQEIHEDGATDLDLETGLNVIANRVKAGYDKVDENPAVLYKLAIAYFDDMEDYKTAAKYFGMIPEDDEEYGELADYYGSVSLILSSTDPNNNELISEVNSFAEYNQSQYTNDNPNKFVNYKNIGRIYATYMNVDGVAEQSEEVMEQALEDLEECTSSDIDTNDYAYAYYDNLIGTYTTRADTASDKEYYYGMAIDACNEYLTILEIKVENNGEVGIGGSEANEYNSSYYNKMMQIAACYKAMDDYDSAISTYETAEQRLGKNNVLSNKVYAEHIDYIYSYIKAKQQDPNKWSKTDPTRLSELLAVYEDSSDVKDISANKTWKKRKSTLDMLESGDYTVQDDEADEATPDTEDTNQEGE